MLAISLRASHRLLQASLHAPPETLDSLMAALIAKAESRCAVTARGAPCATTGGLKPTLMSYAGN